MKIIPSFKPVLSKLVLIGLVFSPFILTSASAAELVGKPATVGQHAAASSLGNQSSSAEAESSAESAFKIDHEAINDVQASLNEVGEDLDDVFGHHNNDDLSLALLIPILAVIFIFGGPVIMVIVFCWLHYRNKARRQQQINTNIDKLLAAGRDIPVELLLGEEAPVIKTRAEGGQRVTYVRDDNMMQKGIKNICGGLGWLVCLTIFAGIKIASFGFIFIGLGISQVIIWKLSGSKVETFKAED